MTNNMYFEDDHPGNYDQKLKHVQEMLSTSRIWLVFSMSPAEDDNVSIAQAVFGAQPGSNIADFMSFVADSLQNIIVNYFTEGDESG